MPADRRTRPRRPPVGHARTTTRRARLRGSVDRACPSSTTFAPATSGIDDRRRSPTYDPEGDDGQENDDLVALSIDGNPATVWSTLCYGSRTLGGKGGVGIVADLGSPAIGTFTVAIASAPYQIQILTAGDGAIPAADRRLGITVEARPSAPTPRPSPCQSTSPPATCWCCSSSSPRHRSAPRTRTAATSRR